MTSCDVSESDNEHGRLFTCLMKAESYIGSHIPPGINWNRIFVILWICLIALNFSRLFYNNYWWDECYSILLSGKPLDEVMYLTEYYDANPPLYYLILKLFCTVFGFEPFVYNLVSFIPYLLSMILALTVTRKRLGIVPAAIIILSLSIFDQSLYFITEVRAYEWTLFFMYVMATLCYEILIEPKTKYYVLITIVYICACYTHYYALMCGGLILLALIIKSAIEKDRNGIMMSSLSLLISFLMYIPWMQFFTKVSDDITTDFWIGDIPSTFNCIEFMFSYNPVKYIFIFFMVVTVIYIISKIFKIKATDGFLSFFHKDKEKWSFIFIGLFCVFGVILFMMTISYLKNPVLYVRYTYPFSVIVWMIVGIFISGIKAKKIFTAVVLILLISFSIPACTELLTEEYREGIEINETLNLTSQLLGDGDVIVTDQSSINKNEFGYYYPGHPFDYIMDNKMPDMFPDEQYWLFLGTEINDALQNDLAEKGHTVQLEKENGRMGSHPIWIYKVL